MVMNPGGGQRRVIVVPYDPHWPGRYASAAEEVSAALGAGLLALHHIGSTSIPGMHAKPVIDMLAVASDLDAIDRHTDAMRRLGYEAMGELGIAGRRYFRRDDSDGNRTHHVHAFADGSPHIARHLAFRDFLRAHPREAEEYANLKIKLAWAHPHDIQAYMDGKDAFIREIERRAMQWQVDRTGR